MLSVFYWPKVELLHIQILVVCLVGRDGVSSAGQKSIRIQFGASALISVLVILGLDWVGFAVEAWGLAVIAAVLTVLMMLFYAIFERTRIKRDATSDLMGRLYAVVVVLMITSWLLRNAFLYLLVTRLI